MRRPKCIVQYRTDVSHVFGLVSVFLLSKASRLIRPCRGPAQSSAHRRCFNAVANRYAVARRQNHIGPCFDFGPRDRPHSSFPSPSCRGGWRADKAHGLDRQAGDGTACGRALGVKRHAPRLAARQRGIFGLRLNQRSGRTRSYMSLVGLFPRPPVGQACVIACPQVPPPVPALRTPPEGAPRLWIGMGPSIITLSVKSTAISLMVNE